MLHSGQEYLSGQGYVREKITKDDKGRLMCNGKYMSDSAIEQRLRRFCTRRKSGHVPCGEEILKGWEGEQHGDLIETFKRCDLNKAQPILEQYCKMNMVP